MISSIVERLEVTCWILPTSPEPLTTGMPTLIPSLDPLSMSTLLEKLDTAAEMTRAWTRGMLPTQGMLTSARSFVSSSIASAPCTFCPLSLSTCARSRSFSDFTEP